MESAAEIITWLFVAANTGRVLAYVPQIISAWNCKNGARSISRLTWGYFAVAHLTGVLYATYVNHDPRMALMFFGNLVICCVLVAIVTWKKASHTTDPLPTARLEATPIENPWGTAIFAKLPE